MSKTVHSLRELLRHLQKQAEERARQFPSLQHMLVLPRGQSAHMPAAHPHIGQSAYLLAADEPHYEDIVDHLLPKQFWPGPSRPTRLFAIADSWARREKVILALRPPRQEPEAGKSGNRRSRKHRVKLPKVMHVHALFGEADGLIPLRNLASDVMDLSQDLTVAWFPTGVYHKNPLFFESPMPDIVDDYEHADEQHAMTGALDGWLCTVHCWAWKNQGESGRTPLQVVEDGCAYPASRSEPAVREGLSFSALNRNVFLASKDTIDLFLRFFDEPPYPRWEVDYPPPTLDAATIAQIEAALKKIEDLERALDREVREPGREGMKQLYASACGIADSLALPCPEAREDREHRQDSYAFDEEERARELRRWCDATRQVLLGIASTATAGRDTQPPPTGGRFIDDAPLSPKQLAETFDVDSEQLRQRLNRARLNKKIDFLEVADRKACEAKYLYRVREARPIAEALREKLLRSGKTSSERPAKKKSR